MEKICWLDKIKKLPIIESLVVSHKAYGTPLTPSYVGLSYA